MDESKEFSNTILQDGLSRPELTSEAKEAINRYLRDLFVGAPENRLKRSRRLRLSTLLLMVLAFGLGLSVRNIADGLHPLAIRLWLPTSDSSLRPGDVILIENPAEPTLHRKVTVLADYTISLPYIGDVSVRGDNLRSLETSLRTKLSPFFRNADVIEVYRADYSEHVSK